MARFLKRYMCACLLYGGGAAATLLFLLHDYGLAALALAVALFGGFLDWRLDRAPPPER
ncbi:MAG: hypothetical protein ACFB2Z_11810 [Maricaulaceae bacterium]